MKVLARVAMGLALLGGVAATQPAAVSAQVRPSEAAQFCEEELVPDFFPTIGACVSAIATANGPGKAVGVAECKYLFAAGGVPQRFFGDCVRTLQGGR
jgi:hypothetical protein